MRAVLFDFDYTLADPSGWVFAALNAGLSAAHLPERDDYSLKKLIGLPLDQQFEQLGGRGADARQYSAFRNAYISFRDAHASVGTHFFKTVPATLTTLNQAGYVLGIVSTGARKRIVELLNREGLMRHFRVVVGGCKDKAEGIRRTVQELGVSNDDSLYVGDRPDDREFAMCANIRFIAVCSGAFKSSEFPVGTEVANDVAELLRNLGIHSASDR